MLPVYIQAFSTITPLGRSTAAGARGLFAGTQCGLSHRAVLIDGREAPVGRVPLDLSDDACAVRGLRSDNNRLLFLCLAEIEGRFAELAARQPASRVGVVVGTSTSGMREGERAFKARCETGVWPDDHLLATQELGDPALVLASHLGIRGPAYTVSTACSSSAKAIASAARLIQADICDVVLTGGGDTVCGLTLNGFASLDAISSHLSNPFSRNRHGINLGEGAALLILSRYSAELRLAGWGETSDAYHVSAPDPTGTGASTAIYQSLKRAGLAASEVGYINLHGTGTPLNDAMEAHVVNGIFGAETPCSSTKPLTGHMLGAAGACEATFVALSLMSGGLLPPHRWDAERDPALPDIALVAQPGQRSDCRYMMSCSYAFGGSNAVLILGRE